MTTPLLYQEGEKSYYRVYVEIHALIVDLFEYVEYDMSTQTGRSNYGTTPLMGIINHTRSHVEDRDVLKHLCREIDMGSKTVYRHLKSHVGMSVKNMVDTLRVDKAEELLSHAKKNMNCIIDEYRFDSESAFCRIFRQSTGITPREYRQKRLEQKNDGILKGYPDFEECEAETIILEVSEKQK